MSPNKTLYIRDDDAQIWQEAEELVKEKKIESLSKLATDSIRKEVERMKELATIKEGIKRISIELDDEKGTRKIAFNGKWLAENYEFFRDVKYLVSVALTERESYFVLWDSQGHNKDTYEIFDYFNDFTDSDSIPEELKSIVAAEVGEDYVEFLDI